MATGWTAVLAAVFVTLAIAHSALGERAVISPLLAQSWSIRRLPRPAADRLLRFAWHLTSLAWLGLAAVVVGASGVAVAGLIALASAGLVLSLQPSHLAWPLFLLGAFAAGVQTGVLGARALTALAIAGIVVLGAAAAVHAYWASGGVRGLDAALPRTRDDGGAVTAPPTWMTGVVVVALALFAGAMAARLAGVASPPVTAIVATGTVVLALRVIGDRRYVGMSKRIRATRFARADDRLWTPLTALLAFGAAAALLV